MKRLCWRLAVLLLALLVPAPARAVVVRAEIRSRTDLAGGQPFGLAGPYEKIVGTLHYAVRPDDPHDRGIVDLALAPRNAAGEVEFSADFYVLRPKDAARGSGSLLLEVPNRGGKAILGLMNRGQGSLDPTSPEELGDGFLMRRGVTVAWVGWQWDVREEPGRMRLHAPVATQDGKPITGLVRADFLVDEPQASHPLGHVIVGSIGGTGYPVADPSARDNVLTERDAPLAPRRVVPRKRWRFAREQDGRLVHDDRSIALDGGFQPGKVYEVVYVAKDPVVAGLGFAAIRDAASYFKYDPQSVAPVERVYGLGISQCGRFLRMLLKQGFNADEAGRAAFDGLFVHVAGAGIGSFNHRFAQPSRDAQPTQTLFYPTDLFPFTDLPETDPETHETGGLLDRARAEHVVPKIFETNTSHEYWSRAAALTETSADGRADAELPGEVRHYFFAGLQHFSGPFPPRSEPYRGLRATHPQNPNPVAWLWRALFADMDAWVRDGEAPPDSLYPLLADKSLVAPEALGFPKIPGLVPPTRPHQAFRMDYGPRWAEGIVTLEPPKVGAAFPTLVPRVDADGNDVSGVRIPEMSVPVATYTGWNLRDPATGLAGERVSFIGSYVPFAATRAARERSSDPRPSLEERYGSRDGYLARFTQAALRQVGARFLLKQDLADVLERGAAEWDAAAHADEPPVVHLWPAGAPGSEGRSEPEKVRVTDAGERVVSSVHHPSLTPYLADAATATGAGVVVMPGGGHRELWTDHEGHRVAAWLSAHGVSAFVLKYRLAREAGSPYTVEEHALADARRALSTVRSRAGEWRVDPERLGVMGFSAGGELAALAALRGEPGQPEASDPVERQSSRPDFQVLVYPGRSASILPTPQSPPAFLLCGADDRTDISEGLANVYLRFKQAGVPAELHIYSGVGHGFGLRATNTGPVAHWPDRVYEWLDGRGLLNSPRR